MSRANHAAAVAIALAIIGGAAPRLAAHSGPPFPIVETRTIGPYAVSVWTDPDATDDGKAAGRFWVTLAAANGRTPLPDDTRAGVTIRPTDRPGGTRSGRAEPIDHQSERRFVALLMDHEGPFAVHLAIDGPLGRADLDANVDATYDLRPRRILMLLYIAPFVLVGLLWGKLLVRRAQL